MRLFFIELKKIFLIIKKDPRAMGAGIVAPSLVLIMFSLLFGGLQSMLVSFQNNDTGLWGKRFVECIEKEISPLGNIPYFKDIGLTFEQALSKYNRGEIVGIIVIPEDFSARIDGQKNPVIEYYLQNFSSDFAKNMRLYLQEGVFSFYKKYNNQIKIEVEENFIVATQVEWIDIIATGTFLLAFIIGGMFTYLYVFFKEKQYHTIVLYKIAPNSPLASFAARCLVALISALITGVFNGLLVYLILGINLFAQSLSALPAILLIVFIYIFIAAILSLLIKNFFGAAIGVMSGAMIFWFFSGGFTAVEPANRLFLLGIYRLVPNSYALDLIRGEVFGFNHHSSLFNYSFLVGYFIILFIVSIILYRKKLWH